MALPSPQDLPQVQTRQEGSTRFQGAVAPHINTGFLDTFSRAVSANEAAKVQAKKEQLTFLSKDVSNQMEKHRQEAQGVLALSQGKNAFKEMGDQEAQLKAKGDELLDSYPEEFRPYLKQHIDSSLGKFRGFSIPYVAGQAKQVKDDVAKTFTANQINDSIEHSGDLDYLATQGRVNVEFAARDAAQRLYGNDPESKILVENAVASAVSSTYVNSVQMQAFNGSIDRAQQIHDKFQSEMSPSDQVKSAKILEKARSDIGTKESVNIVDSALDQFPDSPQLQEMFIRQNSKDTKEYKERIGIQSQRWRIIQEQKEQDTNTVLAQLNRDMEARKPMNPDLLNKLPIDKKAEFLKMADDTKGFGVIATDWKSHDALKQKLYNATKFSEVKNINLDAYRHLISADQMAPLEKRYDNLRKADTDQIIKGQLTDGSAIEVDATRLASSLGILPENKKRMGEFISLSHRVFNKLRDENPKLPYLELKSKWYNEMREKGVKKVPTNKSWYNFGTPEFRNQPNEELANPGTPHQSVVDFLKTKYPGISDEAINRGIQQLKSNGVDVTKPLK